MPQAHHAAEITTASAGRRIASTRTAQAAIDYQPAMRHIQRSNDIRSMRGWAAVPSWESGTGPGGLAVPGTGRQPPSV
jgi:hypothetical protein